MKKHSALSVRIILGFVILAGLLCAACTAVGYTQYWSYIQKQYNDWGYEVAEIVRDYCSEETLIRYLRLAQAYNEGTADKREVEELVQSEEYKRLYEQLDMLQENVRASDIYVAWLNMEELTADNGARDATIVYVFDTYDIPEKHNSFGDTGYFDEEDRDAMIEVFKTGERSDCYFISDGTYGYVTMAILPIQDGDMVGGIFVEIPMLTLQSATRSYVRSIIIEGIVVTALCCIIYSIYLYRTMIKPLYLIVSEASSFVEGGNRISDKLETIHTKDEIQLLSETVLKMETDINQYIENLTKVTAEKERIGTELEVATQIQADMLPGIFPAFPDRKEFEIFASMNPAKEVGGDFYDFFLVDEDHLALVIGDVSGKGVPAALFMVIAKTLIKNEAQMGHSPKEIMESVNNQLCENNQADMFVTVWLGVLELSTGILSAVSAGHEYPMVRRAESGFELLEDPHGFVMGVMENMPYEEYTLQLHKGDGIFIYTDGVPDAADADGNQFGRERTLEVLNTDPGVAPGELLGSVKQELDDFVKEADQFDDITMLCVAYNAPV